MRQIIRIPLQLEEETEESFKERCVLPYPLIIHDPVFFRKRLNLLGFGQAEVRIDIVDGVVKDLNFLYYDGSIMSKDQANEEIERVQRLLNYLTRKHDFSFNNDEKTIPYFNNEEFEKEMELAWNNYKV